MSHQKPSEASQESPEPIIPFEPDPLNPFIETSPVFGKENDATIRVKMEEKPKFPEIDEILPEGSVTNSTLSINAGESDTSSFYIPRQDSVLKSAGLTPTGFMSQLTNAIQLKKSPEKITDESLMDYIKRNLVENFFLEGVTSALWATGTVLHAENLSPKGSAGDVAIATAKYVAPIITSYTFSFYLALSFYEHYQDIRNAHIQEYMQEHGASREQAQEYFSSKVATTDIIKQVAKQFLSKSFKDTAWEAFKAGMQKTAYGLAIWEANKIWGQKIFMGGTIGAAMGAAVDSSIAVVTQIIDRKVKEFRGKPSELSACADVGGEVAKTFAKSFFQGLVNNYGMLQAYKSEESQHKLKAIIPIFTTGLSSWGISSLVSVTPRLMSKLLANCGMYDRKSKDSKKSQVQHKQEEDSDSDYSLLEEGGLSVQKDIEKGSSRNQSEVVVVEEEIDTLASDKESFRLTKQGSFSV